MKTLNLVDLEKSEIKCKISRFPDGQQQVFVDPSFYSEDIKGVVIKSRLNNFSDLELIICAKKSLQCQGILGNVHLYVPYFLGSRSDRCFILGENNYLRDVICPIINSLNFDSVTVVDPHSDVLEACLNNFMKKDNEQVVRHALFNFKLPPNSDKYILISPDAGANKKIYKLAEQIGYKGDIITCSKSRDVEGKLSKTIVPLKLADCYKDKDYIIIDDICDGGRTFINIANELQSLIGKKSKLYLIVTHGVFSKGFAELSKYFDGIYCTNSYKDISSTEWDGDKTDVPTGVKQLNVF